MPLNVYKRPSGVFHIRGTHCGQRVDRSSGARTLKDARAIASKWEKEIFERYVYGTKAVATFAEAAAGYLRSGGSADFLEPILLAVGSKPLKDLSQVDLDALAHKLYPTAQGSTRNRRVYTPFIAVFSYAALAGLSDRRVWKRPKQPQGRLDWRTPAEIERLLAAVTPSARAICTFYVGTGARASEAVALDWKDITPAAQRAVLWETKSGYSRHVDLCPRTRAALPARPVEGGAVFLSARGTPWHAYDALNLALRRACDDIGIEHLSCHTLRHTWATWAYAVTRDLPWLMQQGGWRTAQLAMRYTHVGARDLADEVLAHGWHANIKGSATQAPLRLADKSSG